MNDQMVEVSVREVPMTEEDLRDLQGLVEQLVDRALEERAEPESPVLVGVTLRLTWERPAP